MSSALVVGSPNSGKSLLFNRLTGLNQKVANFPGITVDTHAGRSRRHRDLQLVDLPGVYSLQALSGEEEVAIAAFQRALLQVPPLERVPRQRRVQVRRLAQRPARYLRND